MNSLGRALVNMTDKKRLGPRWVQREDKVGTQGEEGPSARHGERPQKDPALLPLGSLTSSLQD